MELFNQPGFVTLMTALVAAAASSAGLVLGKRLQAAQAEKLSADARNVDAATAEKVQQIYQDMLNDVTAKVALLSAEQSLMKTVHFALVETLNTSIAGLQTLISEQRGTITELRDQIEALNKRIADLSDQLRATGQEPVKAQ